MRRRIIVALASVLLSSLVATGHAAFASPVADVPEDHWAYAYIQSLAADGLVEGYPDGFFKGDRPLTRNEMAAIVSRALAKLQTEDHADIARLASKGDLEKLQQLVFALKDELDGMGVRVGALEDAVAQLDQRTKTAQSLQFHGELDANGRNRTWTAPRTITNGTGADAPLWYGATAPAGGSAPADPFFTSYVASGEENLPFVDQSPGVQLAQSDRFVLSYAVTDALTVSLPIRILDLEYGNSLGASQQIDVEPSIKLDLSHSGALSNLHLTYGDLDTLPSSRTGLTFRAPFGDQAGDPYADPFGTPLQPTQRGVSIAGTLLGLTDFSVSFSRVDQVQLDTQPTLAIAGVNQAIGYLSPVIPAQSGLLQNGAAQSSQTLTSDAFVAANGPLSQVFLTRTAVLGSIYVSSYNGSTFDASGHPLGGGGPTTPPAFQFSQAYNAVIFAAPLATGSKVTISYAGLTNASNTSYQRYMLNARVNHTFNPSPSARRAGRDVQQDLRLSNIAERGRVALATVAAGDRRGAR